MNTVTYLSELSRRRDDMMACLTCSVKVLSGCSTDTHEAPGFLTKCVLDIDIYKNRPSVHEHVKLPNPEVRSAKCEA